MTPLSIFASIRAKLAIMSSLGIALVFAMLATGWLTSHMVAESSDRQEQLLIVSRNMVDAKASLQAMRVGGRDLRLARTSEDAAKAMGDVQHHHDSTVEYLQQAMSAMKVQADRDQSQTASDLADAYLSSVGELAKMIEAKLQAKALITDISDKEEALRASMLATATKAVETLEEAVEVVKKRADDAGTQMDAAQHLAQILDLGAGALIVITLMSSAVFGSRVIARPISTLAGSMSILADGDFSVGVPYAKRGDEIGSMARAVEVFKQNGIRSREMAHDHEAAMQAQSADLQSSIGVVVSAAVAGDFTQRITKTYENADLARFARGVNELVASVDQGVAETRRVVSALAEGDLTESMRGEFQGAFADLQQNVNATMVNLRSVLGEVRAAIDTIDGGAGEMRVASGDLSKRTEQQAASLEETSSALEEITVAVKSSTARATEASHMVDEARQSTERSSAVVNDAVSAMGRIEQASGEIGQIINVIDEIAFQTNLLALNAGVEAARAGEAGKGFAVVAQEVRELAQRSAGAAKDIKALINRSGEEVNSGVRLVTATGEALTLIQGHVVKINEHVHSIATAAREQSTGLAEVSTAVNEMDQVTQQNAAMVEESTAATNRLAEEASNLARLIARFKLEGGSVTAQPRATGQTSRPVVSPARALGQKLAGAFGGRSATAAAAANWEEF
jgi:methyl-accepting chemotaxis protein